MAAALAVAFPPAAPAEVVSRSVPGVEWSAPDGRTGVAEATFGHIGCGTPDPLGGCVGGVWDGILGATWIWPTRRVTEDLRTATFTDSFTLPRAGPGLLTIRADNVYSASVNGVEVARGDRFEALNGTTADVRLPAGPSTFRVTVTDQAAFDPDINPAGVAWTIAADLTPEYARACAVTGALFSVLVPAVRLAAPAGSIPYAVAHGAVAQTWTSEAPRGRELCRLSAGRLRIPVHLVVRDRSGGVLRTAVAEVSGSVPLSASVTTEPPAAVACDLAPLRAALRRGPIPGRPSLPEDATDCILNGPPTPGHVYLRWEAGGVQEHPVRGGFPARRSVHSLTPLAYWVDLTALGAAGDERSFGTVLERALGLVHRTLAEDLPVIAPLAVVETGSGGLTATGPGGSVSGPGGPGATTAHVTRGGHSFAVFLRARPGAHRVVVRRVPGGTARLSLMVVRPGVRARPDIAHATVRPGPRGVAVARFSVSADGAVAVHG